MMKRRWSGISLQAYAEEASFVRTRLKVCSDFTPMAADSKKPNRNELTPTTLTHDSTTCPRCLNILTVWSPRHPRSFTWGRFSIGGKLFSETMSRPGHGFALLQSKA